MSSHQIVVLFDDSVVMRNTSGKPVLMEMKHSSMEPGKVRPVFAASSNMKF